MKPSIDVLVLNWNGGADTIDCLESLAHVDYPRMRIVVVDNGSTDGSADVVSARFPAVFMLRTGANLGYAGGNNAGIRYCLANAPGDFCLVLNNDTVVDPDFLDELVAAAARYPVAGLFSPRIYFEDRPDVLWFAGARWDPARSDFVHVGYGRTDLGASSGATPTEYASGSALFVRREVVQRVGLLDERFFLLFEEVDYCFRARRQGFDCLVAERSRVWHKVSASIGEYSSPLPSYFHTRNRLLFAERHLSGAERRRLFVRVLCETLCPRVRDQADPQMSPIRHLYWLMRKGELFCGADYRTPAYRARLRAVADYGRRRFGNCPDEIRAMSTGRSLGSTA